MSFCDFIIPHFVGFVKNFFYFLFLDSVRSTWKQSLAHGSKALHFCALGLGWLFIFPFSFILQSYYTTLCWACQGVSQNFSEIFFESRERFSASIRVVSGFRFPLLTIIIIADFREKARWYFTQRLPAKNIPICAKRRAPGASPGCAGERAVAYTPGGFKDFFL